jgi:hypothetical protein
MQVGRMHYVYGLRIGDKYFYVGATSSPSNRYNQHIYSAKTGRDVACTPVIIDALDNGKKIEIDILSQGDKVYCISKEADEIKRLLRDGHPLVNIQRASEFSAICDIEIPKLDFCFVSVLVPIEDYGRGYTVAHTNSFQKEVADLLRKKVGEYVFCNPKEPIYPVCSNCGRSKRTHIGKSDICYTLSSHYVPTLKEYARKEAY